MDYVNDVRLGPQGAFEDLKIDSSDFLKKVEERSPCPKCYKSRKYFCYTCYIPMEEISGIIPCLKLPIQIDIIKYAKEIDGKSTATHAAVLAPDYVNIYTFPDFPSYSEKEKILLIFPGRDSISLESLIQLNQPTPNPIQLSVHSETLTNDCSADNSLESQFSSSMSLKCRNDTSGSVIKSKQSSNNEEFSTCATHLEEQVNVMDGDRNVKKYVKIMEENKQSCCLSSTKDSDNNANEDYKANRSNGSPIESDKSSGSLPTNQQIIENVVSEMEQNSKTLSANSTEYSNTNEFPNSFPYKKAIFIDCTWNQVHKIVKDERLQGIQQVELTKRQSKFWRFQRGKPHTYLSTIEAIYYFLVDTYMAVMTEPYCGQYDNLLFFFKFMYNKIHSLYDPTKMRVYSFKNPSKIPRKKQCLKTNLQR